MVRFDSFLTLVSTLSTLSPLDMPIAFMSMNVRSFSLTGARDNSLSLMVEHHSSKMSILVRFQKRMFDKKLQYILLQCQKMRNFLKKVIYILLRLSFSRRSLQDLVLSGHIMVIYIVFSITIQLEYINYFFIIKNF